MPLVTARCCSVAAMSNLYIAIIATFSTSGVGPLQRRVYDSTAFVEFGSRWNSVPPHSFLHLTDGEKEWTPHSFSPPYRWGRKSELHSFSPSVWWKFESVLYTLFPHCNKMGKKSVPPTLFFPIIEGEKVQRVKVYPYPVRYQYTMKKRHCSVR